MVRPLGRGCKTFGILFVILLSGGVVHWVMAEHLLMSGSVSQCSAWVRVSLERFGESHA